MATNPPLANPLALPGGKTTTFETALIDTGLAGINPNSVDQNFDNAYVQSWNLNIQRELPMGVGLTIGYFGSKGTHLPHNPKYQSTDQRRASVPGGGSQ